MTNTTKQIVIRALKLLRDEGDSQTKKDAEFAIQDLTEFFEITSLSRDDLIGAGFDGEKVDNGTMTQLAEKMADAYCDNGFHIDLPIIAEHLNIPQIN